MQHNPGFKLCLFLPLLQCIIDKMMSPAFVSFTMLFKRISNFRAFIFKHLRWKIHIIHKTLKQLRENKQTMYDMHLHTCVHVHCMGGSVWITVATLLTTLRALVPCRKMPHSCPAFGVSFLHVNDGEGSCWISHTVPHARGGNGRVLKDHLMEPFKKMQLSPDGSRVNSA